MIHHFFADTLQKAAHRIAPGQHTTRFHLDKNEQSADVDFEFKKRVAEKLLDADWNRYPTADYRAIETKIAGYCGLAPENIVLSAGSASIITTLLNYFALNQKHIVITQPSYSLFDYHCKTHNIPYETWLLNDDLEYDYQRMPALKPGSVFFITSPNNPVGNTMDLARLEQLLIDNPDSYIILDGVYTEFCDADPTALVKQYPNLIVLRSFSKAFPIAGLRLGYLCASPETAAIVRKLVLQFSINHFSLLFLEEMLSDCQFMENARKQVRSIVAGRERMYHLINRLFSPNILKVFKSEGNFLLIRVFDQTAFEKLMADLGHAGIKVLNTSGFPLLHHTFRVSIGTAYENEIFLHHLSASLKPETLSVVKPEPGYAVNTIKLPQPVQKLRV